MKAVPARRTYVPTKASTGIAGCDLITGGGLPQGRTTLLVIDTIKTLSKSGNELTALGVAERVAKSSAPATMSHEIGTPMNGTLGMVEVLSLSHMPDEASAMNAVARILVDFEQHHPDFLSLAVPGRVYAVLPPGVSSQFSSVA